MLKKLDVYIIKKYLTTFFFTVLLITMVSVIIDFSEKVEDFIEEPVTIQQILMDYYLNWILWINGLLFPLVAMIAVIFFTSRMAYNSEIISILNAGVSFRRLMRPYLIGAFFIAGLHLLGNHYFIPKGNKVHYDFQYTYIWKHEDKGKTQDVHVFLGPETKAYIKYYRKRDTTARDIRIERFENNRLEYLLKATSAEWLGYPNKWRLKDYEIRTFDGTNESLVIGRRDHIDTTLNLVPEDFVRYTNQPEMMTTGELKELINVERQRGLNDTKAFWIEIYRRWADPFTIIILTLIGMSVAARKVRGGMGLHIAIGLVIGALYVFLSKFSTTFSTNQALHPAIGIWIPNILFGIVALIMVGKAQK